MRAVLDVSADVVIGWVHPGTVHAAFMDSVLLTLTHDREHGQRIAGWTGRRCSANVSSGRNDVVEWFLATHADWLLMADTDMVWQPDAVHRLVDAGDPDRVPIVGGLCFAKERISGAVWPTLYELEPLADGSQFFRFHSWPSSALFPVDGTGAAFLLVHRTVFETVRDKTFSAAYPWFQETENAFGRVSEDLTFCLRARECGFPIHVHTGVQVGHVKEHVVTARDYLAQQMMFTRGGADG